MRRLRALTEVECYLRCYGSGDENVRVVKIEPVRVARQVELTGVARQVELSGEQLRRLFELRLDARGSEAAA